MTEIVLPPHVIDRGRQPRKTLALALGLGAAIVALLWLLNLRYRQVYVPRLDDVTALADALLMRPDARWQDWFTQGHSHFFDAYPEWPWGLSAFARPVFQCTIYLAHFMFGRDWASYLAINYLSVAGPAMVAFVLARSTLRLGLVSSLAAAVLTVLAPAVTEFSIWELGFGSEPLAGFFLGCGFLALVARRHLLCVLFLTVALLTKETAVWAPFAAAVTVLVRPGRRPATTAAAMLLPIAGWLALRFAFFGGIGGTYASPHYMPVADFIAVTGWKLTHFHHLLVSRDYAISGARWLFLDRAARVGTAVFVPLLLAVWVFEAARKIVPEIGAAWRERRAIALDDGALATIWTAAGLGFYFALTLPDLRYATAAVMFLWPVLIAVVARYRSILLRLGLAACFLISLDRGLHYIATLNPPAPQSNTNKLFKAVERMNEALQHLPPNIQQVYVLSAGDDLSDVAPAYLQAFLGVKAEITRVIDMDWDCGAGERIAFTHQETGGVVTLSATLPPCAEFQFEGAIIDSKQLVAGTLRRSPAISYELPEAKPIANRAPRSQIFDLGRHMTASIRPTGPARFIIEPSGPDGALAWFDVPEITPPGGAPSN